MELAKLWEIIWRRKWIVLQSTIIVTLFALFGSYLIKPTFESIATVLVKGPKIGKAETPQEFRGLPGLSAIIVRTHPNIDVGKVMATSTQYIVEMATKLQLRDDNGTFWTPMALTTTGLVVDLKRKFLAQPSVAITQIETTECLQITATSANPQEAKMMASSLAQIMVDRNQAMIRSEYSTARRFLESQLTDARVRYSTAMQEITEFQKREKTVDLPMEGKLVAEKISELMSQREKDIIELAQSRGAIEELKKQLAAQTPEFIYASTLKDSPQIEALTKKLTDIEVQLTQASSELTGDHPRVQELQDQLKLAKATLKREIDVYRTTAPQLVSLQRSIAAVEEHLKGVRQDLNSHTKSLGGLPDKLLHNETLSMEANVSQQIYQALLQALYELSMGEKDVMAEIALLNDAELPLYPTSPKKILNVLLGFFLGLAMGLGLAFLVEYLDDRILTAEDMGQFEPFGVIGVVPKFRQRDVTLITALDANDPLFESYRKIRNALNLQPMPVKTVLVASAGPQEGKSTTVVNLAISCAQEEKRVVLLDMDLRRPRLHTFFALENDLGISDVLQDRADLQSVIQATRIEGLSMIASGPRFPDSGKLIDSTRLAALIFELRERFDMVIIDSAPLLVKNDALVLAKHVDGIVVVVASAKTTQKAVHELMNRMANAGVKPLGFVLNRLSSEKGKLFYHYSYQGKYDKATNAGVN